MKNKDFNKLLLLIPAGLILVGSIVFLYSRPGSGDDRICQENVAKLQKLENADIAQTEQQLQNLKKSEEDDSLRNMCRSARPLQAVSFLEIPSQILLWNMDIWIQMW